ncbi:Arginine exporter protein ArgO [Andreprevotia sp. IGB-42]|uniref:LysE/ArgO family amino acid transporter n=1 Tax=Andreprevotia sp. IGB-42 TaxID=2497473 RepID=UPI001358F447|nr:LysE/ArgO family amino acid transporter [Andreprevotia sp. IGB-42]KAF0814428.1 Arginine exporter protein ArgO [Andreprevotia sp. IGB-42]
MFSIFFKGMALTASLIMAIGAQNAFVLRQGITHRHMFLTALTCSLCDLVLMSAGVAGMGHLLAAAPGLQRWMALAGAVFVLWYGLMALKKAIHPGVLAPEATQGIANPKAVVLAALGFSLLNPHSILDTVVLVGSVGAQQPLAERPLFLAGAVSFSFIWFFALAFGASKLTPLFKKPVAWRILDILIAIMMFAIAWSLIKLV